MRVNPALLFLVFLANSVIPAQSRAVITYCSYLGGSSNEVVWSMKPDGDGGVLICGETSSRDFPVSAGALDTVYGEQGNANPFDGFIARLDENNNLEWCTYLGGNGYELPCKVLLDDQNRVIVGGTATDGFPVTQGAYDPTCNGNLDVFVAGLTLSGDSLIFGTYLGGRVRDYLRSMVVHPDGSFVLTGFAESDNFPTTEDSYDPTFNGGWDAFLAKLSVDGSNLEFSTFIGGEVDGDNYMDTGSDLCIDSQGDIIVCGAAGSNSFPITEGAFDDSFNSGRSDCFVSSFSSDGQSLIYSTFLGGVGEDISTSIISLENDRVIVSSSTTSNDFPTTENVIGRAQFGRYDATLSSLSPDGNQLVFSTYFGGQGYDYPYGLVQDALGGFILVGITMGGLSVVGEDADSAMSGISDGFILQLNEDASSVTFCSYFGGNNQDGIHTVAPDGESGIMFGGQARGPELPVTDDAYQAEHGGAQDGFIARIGSIVEVWWEDFPEMIQVTETDTIHFEIMGRSVTPEDEANYELSIDAGDLSEFINFASNGDGSATFDWITRSGQAGDYVIGVNFFDGFYELEGEIRIIVEPYPLYFDNPPYSITIEEGDGFDFIMIGGSRENVEELSLRFERHNLPESAFFEYESETVGVFTWQTSVGDEGEYVAGFVLSDGERVLDHRVDIIVREAPSLILDPAPPAEFSIQQPHPNPFNSQTSVLVALPGNSDVRLSAVNTEGRVIMSRECGLLESGYHKMDVSAVGWATGTYYLKVESKFGSATCKMLLLR